MTDTSPGTPPRYKRAPPDLGSAGQRGSFAVEWQRRPRTAVLDRARNQPQLLLRPPQPAKTPTAITARDWAKCEGPGSHVGEAIIVYGEVTQFDAATGTQVFRANV
jgi:hypothetical protein